MFSRAMTRSTRIGSGDTARLQQRLGGETQALLEADTRLPPEQLARGGDVGPRVAHVAGPVGEELALDVAAEDAADLVRELVHRGAAAGGDVEDGAVHALGVGREQVRLDDVADVREVA